MKALAAILALLPLPALADEAAWTLRSVPEWHAARDDSPFAAANAVSGLGRDRWRNELELRWAPAPLDLIATARSTAQQGREPDNELVVNQAAFSMPVGEQHFGFGKKIFSWDVGFGFRPLDLIQRENRRALFPPTLEGVPYLAWERFTADASWLLLYANPGRGRAGDPVDDESLALKYYARHGDTDLHLVAGASRRFGLEAGTAASRVAGDALELHGSLLWQQRYERDIDRLAGSAQLLSLADPIETRRYAHGIKALAGLTWSTPAGASLLAEAWYDGSALSRHDWQAAADLARRQAALVGRPGVPDAAVAGNLAYGSRYFEPASLLRENILLRASRKPEGSDRETAADLLLTPADGGRVLTFSLTLTRNRYRIDAGLRFFGGPPDAAYRLLPERRVGFVALSIGF